MRSIVRLDSRPMGASTSGSASSSWSISVDASSLVVAARLALREPSGPWRRGPVVPRLAQQRLQVLELLR